MQFTRGNVQNAKNWPCCFPHNGRRCTHTNTHTMKLPVLMHMGDKEWENWFETSLLPQLVRFGAGPSERKCHPTSFASLRALSHSQKRLKNFICVSQPHLNIHLSNFPTGERWQDITGAGIVTIWPAIQIVILLNQSHGYGFDRAGWRGDRRRGRERE